VRSVKREIYSNDETPDESKSKKLQPKLEQSIHEDWFCTGVVWFHVFTSLHLQCYFNVIHLYTIVVKLIRTFF